MVRRLLFSVECLLRDRFSLLGAGSESLFARRGPFLSLGKRGVNTVCPAGFERVSRAFPRARCNAACRHLRRSDARSDLGARLDGPLKSLRRSKQLAQLIPRPLAQYTLLPAER